jgi:hypothetical protein
LDFSKLKLEVYDLLGVILPGLLAIFEGWILLRGWGMFALAMNQLSVSGFTLLVVFAFGVGNLVQEFGDVVIKRLKGGRFFRLGRDKFWATAEANPVKAAIKSQLGTEITSVDTAFDYSLTKLKDSFAKRDVFVATSDLCRSLAVLSILAIIPAIKIAWLTAPLRCRFLIYVVIAIALLILLAARSWRRMVRFRELSEVTVFRAYLATVNESEKK